ncbi:hypothetical protein PV458_09735 [Streptomyces sp. MN03-5084-2B]|nr:hypothetical protein [Streptomyces sp. MN03-5084-2B]
MNLAHKIPEHSRLQLEELFDYLLMDLDLVFDFGSNLGNSLLSSKIRNRDKQTVQSFSLYRRDSPWGCSAEEYFKDRWISKSRDEVP